MIRDIAFLALQLFNVALLFAAAYAFAYLGMSL